MKKINAYVGDCVSENIGVIIDDYPNKEGNSEFAVNLNVGDSFITSWVFNGEADINNMVTNSFH